jgi:hypothetical protein
LNFSPRTKGKADDEIRNRDEELRQAEEDALRGIWGGKRENMPGTEDWFAKRRREGAKKNAEFMKGH